MKYRKAVTISFIISCLGLAVFIVPFLISRNSSDVFKFLGAACIIAGLIIYYKFCRCPKCRRIVRVHSVSLPDYCPFCGEQLDPESSDY